MSGDLVDSLYPDAREAIRVSPDRRNVACADDPRSRCIMHAMIDVILRSDRVVAGGQVRPAAIVVREERIVAVQSRDHKAEATQDIDVGNLVIAPGLVDSHVHVNEPGRTDWEGWETASRAAAAGGITTLVDMPLNSDPVTTTVDALQEKARLAGDKSIVDFGLWGGLISGNESDVADLVDGGALGIKCFLVPSGLASFPPVDQTQLTLAASLIAPTKTPILVHAEWPSVIEAHARTRPLTRYADYLATRPREAEIEAIKVVCRVAQQTGCRFHIVHITCAECIDAILDANTGLVTWETCPHYLHFCAEEIPDGATEYKCAPPIRSREDRRKLWEAIEIGDLDMIVTDHSPCPPEMKRSGEGDFNAAWGGIASLQFSLAAVWTDAVAHGYTPADLARWMSERPSQLAGLDMCKGAIKPGRDADFVIWDPDETRTVNADGIYHRHRVSPYVGRALRGVVHQTWVRGRLVFDEGRFDDDVRGRWLTRGNDGSE